MTDMWRNAEGLLYLNSDEDLDIMILAIEKEKEKRHLPKGIPEGIEIITPPKTHTFKCYNCGTEFSANYKNYYETQTGWGCKCPMCTKATYTKT